MTDIVLETNHLIKNFGPIRAVKDLTLQVREGEVFGFLGPNGAGKTTSINMMCGLMKPDGGQVIVKNRPASIGSSEFRRLVGMCPQNIVLWERLTCLEQLMFMGQMYGVPSGKSRRTSERLLAELGLEEKRDSQARRLSGGMQRRLNLAMALVHEPEIVVLDEPEAGLDPQSRVKVREYIQSLARKKTVILTTHNMDEADRIADRIAIIDHGELLVLDTPEKLKQSLGEGDLIEIKLENGNVDAEAAGRALAGISRDVKMEGSSHILQVRALNAVGSLSTILDVLTRSGFKPGEVSIRANSLEDVFIQLTGRKLRE